jgi:hypothetical protein
MRAMTAAAPAMSRFIEFMNEPLSWSPPQS